VIFLIIDTLRADKVGAYGFTEPVSPELDQLASEGVRFDRAITQCSWTRPSIGSMLTGIYPRTLGLYEEERERLGDDVETLSELFQRHGYTTLGVTANPNINEVFGFNQGFDAYVDSQMVWPWMDVDPKATGGAKQKKATEAGQLATANEVFDKAFELVKEHRGKPYFVQLNIMEMHHWGPSLRAEYAQGFDGKRDGGYLRKVRQVSRDVGDFIDEWLAQPELEDTLVVVLSDHGEGLADHEGIPGSQGHGRMLYETHLRVPLVFYHSKGGLGSGLVVEQPVRVMDVFPTLADLFGFEVSPKVDGVSLRPAMAKPDAKLALPKRFVAETYFKNANKQSVYSPQWNFYKNMDQWASGDDWPGMDPKELQRARAREQGSRTNQIGAHPEEAVALEAFLREWEKKHPKAEPIVPEEVPETVNEQLRALGYIE
jgi:arylsulfatase A-like enzyme